MTPLADAQAKVLEACAPPAPSGRTLSDAYGCVLAETVHATEPVPPFSSSAMDGYAVRAVDVSGASERRPARLRVIGTLAAGSAATTPVCRGEALRIMTGAPFPTGVDAIAIVETTRTDGEDVLISTPAPPMVHVRPAGEDLAAGQEVFGAGTTLGAGHLGVLASVGLGKVSVVAPPVVGVLSTGDELVEAGERLAPGQIRDSNRLTLLGLLRRDGFSGIDLGRARDVEVDIRDRITDGATRCDAVLTSGGVSMGDFDYVKKVLDDLGSMSWMQVAIRPAKPFAFGVIANTPIFGLPGNPVSSMVSYELLARPGLRRMSGRPPDRWLRPTLRAVADDDRLRRHPDGRDNLARVVASVGSDGRLHVRSAGGQGSNLLFPMALSNALAVVPDGLGVPAGGEVDILLVEPPHRR
ncbi:MAG: molybdopterin molybdotransferase MoeA [Acidimicrobiales bacterium]